MSTPPLTPKWPRARGHASETWEERFPRYAHNARITAQQAASYAGRQLKAAELHDHAARNARNHDDLTAAGLYTEMSEAALDAANALKDIANLARKIEQHYTRLSREDLCAGPEQEK